MRKVTSLIIGVLTILPLVSFAQEITNAVAGELVAHGGGSPAYWEIIGCPGPSLLTFFPWLGLVFFGIAVLPLGIKSIKQCAGAQTPRWPLPTKLIICGGVGVMVSGLLGTLHGFIFAFATLSYTTAGEAQQALMAINIAVSLYPLGAALVVVQLYLLFFVISMVKMHFRQQKLTAAQ